MQFSSLCLVLTTKCNAECDICYLSCSPRVNDKMPLDKALSYIRQASEIDSITSMGITGGEPFLYYDDLLDIIKAANSYKLVVSCGTNGFWAMTEEIAGQKLDELIHAGLSYLSISVDAFHKEYVSIENVRNILRAAKVRDVSIRLTCTVTKNSMNSTDIAQVLGEDISGFSIIEAPCLPIGNALDRIDSKEFIYEENLPFDKCFSENALTVKPDGSAFPCLLTPALYLGSLNEQSMNMIIDNFCQNSFINSLEKQGCKWLINIIRENKLPIGLKDRYVSLCDVCHTLFKQKEYLDQYLSI